MTNKQKRATAFERIKEKLKESEKDLSAGQADAKDSVINLAIELAVRYIKNLKP